MSDGLMDKTTLRWKQIEKFLETNPFIMNADVRNLCNVSAATANRILAGLAAEGNLVQYREGGHWAYRSNICESIPSIFLKTICNTGQLPFCFRNILDTFSSAHI